MRALHSSHTRHLLCSIPKSSHIFSIEKASANSSDTGHQRKVTANTSRRSTNSTPDNRLYFATGYVVLVGAFRQASTFTPFRQRATSNPRCGLLRSGQLLGGSGTFGPAPGSKLAVRMPAPSRLGISLSLLCAGIVLFPAYNHWVLTRTWVAVDMPISLAPGHLRTGSFNVNLSTTYQINIELHGYEYWRYPDCHSQRVIQARWWLSRDRRVVSTWKDYWGSSWNFVPSDFLQGTYLGTFDSSTGRYNLDIEMVSDATCLQAFHPRLRVYADDSDYVRGGWVHEMALLASFPLVGIGIAFLLVSSTEPFQAKITHGQSLAIFDTLRAKRQSAQRKFVLMGPASIVPTVGYVCALTYFLLFLAAAPFQLARFSRSLGIPARLLRPSFIQVSSDRQTTGLLVYVDRSGNLYKNSKPITAEELPRALEEEFARRADWSVYVEGDSATEYRAVVHAMDLVRSAQGKVIMLTPNMRAEEQASHH